MAETLNNDDRKKSQPKPLSRRVMILTTTAILFGNVTFGCVLNSLSPALENMKSKYGSTVQDISLVYTISTISYLIGAIACGFISKYVNRQLVVIFSLIGFATSMFIIPFCPSILWFFVFGGLTGFSSGFYDSSQMVWIIEIWQHKAGPFIQAQHFCYAIGAIVPTLIVAPYLNKYDQFNVLVEPSTIQIPFISIGAFVSLALAFQLFLFIFYRYEKPPMYANENFELTEDAKKMIPTPIDTDLSGNVSINRSENVNVVGISRRKLKLITFAMMFLGSYQAMEVSTFQFLPIFGQYSDLKMEESASAYVLTGLMVMYAIGRGIGVIVIFKVRPELIIVINFVLIVTGNLILLLWANDSLAMFWMGSAILGTGFSTMFPSFCAFIEKYLVFTNSVASCIIFVASIATAIYPLIIGKIIEQHAVVLAFVNFASTAVCVIVMLWGYLLTRKSVNRER